MTWKTVVGVTIGRGMSFVIQEDNDTPFPKDRLALEDDQGNTLIPLGSCTKKRIEELQTILERLKPHAE